MKNTLLRLLPLLALVFVFSSCQKSEDLRPGDRSSSSSTISSTQLQQNIIFQYAEFDEEGNMNNGWVVMKDGSVRNYQYESGEWNATNHSCSANDMLRLEASVGEKIGSVDIDELNENFDKIDAASHFVSVPKVNDETSPYIAFFAYKANDPPSQEATAGSCNYDTEGSSNFNSPYFSQILLSMEGGMQLVNQVEAAKEILTWLEAVHNEVYF